MKKFLFLTSYFLVFCLGFFGKVILEKYGVRFTTAEQKILEQNTQPVSGVDQFMTFVNFENGEFDKKAVKVHKGDYLAVTNVDQEDQMWLVATMSGWTTQRGFAQGERISLTMNEEGRFEVVEKISGAVLEVEVYQ